MENVKIQKPRINTDFRSIKVVKLVSHLRFEFNIDFLHRGVSLCMLKDSFLNVKFRQLQ